MNKSVSTQSILLGIVLFTPILLVGCRDNNPTTPGDSPEAAYRAMCDAVQAKDWNKAVSYLAPESRDSMVEMFALMGGFIALDPEHGPAVEDIFVRHGLEQPESEQAFGEATEPLSADITLTYQRPFLMHVDKELAEPPLFATLSLDGKPIAEASQIGFAKISSARDDLGKQLACLKAKRSIVDVDGDFIKATDDPFIKERMGPVEIDVMLERPSDEAKSIAMIEGSVQLITGGQAEEVVVDNVTRLKPDTTVENEKLQATGVTLKTPSYATTENSVGIVVQGPIWSIELVDGQGKTVDAQWFQARDEVQFQSEAPLSDDTGLKLVVLVGQTPVTVPFRFEDLPLPVEGEEETSEGDFFEGSMSQEDLRKMIDAIQDKNAFVAEMVALLDKTDDGETGGPAFASGKLMDLKVEGNMATAINLTEQNGRQQRAAIEFHRIDGRWLVHFPKGDPSM